MTARWVSGLVRARQFQEDSAKQHLATAERLASRAHARVRYNEEHLDSLRRAHAEESAPSFVAAAAALQAAAATHAAAAQAAVQADRDAVTRRGDLTDASVSRRSAEELAERARAAEKARQEAIAQRAQDEIAASVFRRTHEGDTPRADAEPVIDAPIDADMGSAVRNAAADAAADAGPATVPFRMDAKSNRADAGNTDSAMVSATLRATLNTAVGAAGTAARVDKGGVAR